MSATALPAGKMVIPDAGRGNQLVRQDENQPSTTMIGTLRERT